MVICCCYRNADLVADKGSKSCGDAVGRLRRCPPPRLVDDRQNETEVFINVYSLAKRNKQLKKFGMGVFHCGVVVCGIEWGYGESVDPSTQSGLFCVYPGQAAGTLYRTIFLGTTTCTPQQVDTILHRLENEWVSGEYHILAHNCNHFAQRFCDLLSTTQKLRIPSWCNRAARVCDKIIPRRLASYVHRLFDESPPRPQACPRSRVSELPTSVIPNGWYYHHMRTQKPRYVTMPDPDTARRYRERNYRLENNNKFISSRRPGASNILAPQLCGIRDGSGADGPCDVEVIRSNHCYLSGEILMLPRAISEAVFISGGCCTTAQDDEMLFTRSVNVYPEKSAELKSFIEMESLVSISCEALVPSALSAAASSQGFGDGATPRKSEVAADGRRAAVTALTEGGREGAVRQGKVSERDVKLTKRSVKVVRRMKRYVDVGDSEELANSCSTQRLSIAQFPVSDGTQIKRSRRRNNNCSEDCIAAEFGSGNVTVSFISSRLLSTTVDSHPVEKEGEVPEDGTDTRNGSPLTTKETTRFESDADTLAPSSGVSMEMVSGVAMGMCTSFSTKDGPVACSIAEESFTIPNNNAKEVLNAGAACEEELPRHTCEESSKECDELFSSVEGTEEYVG
ncbi:PPPDE putative peptidase domain [Trypanosoma vivax]|uniref:PPPDE domain-containing protein n=1 Tax=Trypanosoma vivax (strain Y486) TaxID=1055687 RepID=G0UB78_TRYVY|nr:PPPDE putative peptidase domain [Trypanosoma vivax]CCC53065.1 conserved hypothetical protein [Trypanosoma vivax Y486]